MNVLELEVRDGVARVRNWSSPPTAWPTARKCASASALTPCRFPPTPPPTAIQAILRRTYFLGVMLRLEMELPSGLIVRSRMSKEDYARLGLADGRQISFQIRAYRVLAKEGDPLADEVATSHDMQPQLGEGI